VRHADDEDAHLGEGFFANGHGHHVVIHLITDQLGKHGGEHGEGKTFLGMSIDVNFVGAIEEAHELFLEPLNFVMEKVHSFAVTPH